MSGFRNLFSKSSSSSFESSFGARRESEFQPDTPAPLPATADPAIPEEPVAPPPDLEELLQAAREEGAAEERGRVEVELQELQAQSALLSAALAEVEELRPRALRDAAADVGDLVLSLTSRILESSIALHPDALGSLLERALVRFPDKDKLRIRIPVGSLESLRDRVEPAVAQALVEDPKLHAGVVVESEHGSVESSVEAAMEAVEEAVRTWQEASSC